MYADKIFQMLYKNQFAIMFGNKQKILMSLQRTEMSKKPRFPVNFLLRPHLSLEEAYFLYSLQIQIAWITDEN